MHSLATDRALENLVQIMGFANSRPSHYTFSIFKMWHSLDSSELEVWTNHWIDIRFRSLLISRVRSENCLVVRFIQCLSNFFGPECNIPNLSSISMFDGLWLKQLIQKAMNNSHYCHNSGNMWKKFTLIVYRIKLHINNAIWNLSSQTNWLATITYMVNHTCTVRPKYGESSKHTLIS